MKRKQGASSVPEWLEKHPQVAMYLIQAGYRDGLSEARFWDKLVPSVCRECTDMDDVRQKYSPKKRARIVQLASDIVNVAIVAATPTL